MTNYRAGDIILAPFPFTDLSTTKKRPVLVLLCVSPQKLPPLLVVAMITSQIDSERIPGDFVLKHWKKAGLIHPSKTRLAKLVTLEENMVLGHLGRLVSTDWKQIKKIFLKLLSLK